ncbi:protein-tyrosine phosphatase [Leucobacter komagatae]|uniref:Protein-tyrosine phosphatase n=1 Tax=Leucobacter komagatae TaxID=55969 RepID=A0A542Y437_9MICO|nr:tyrosine-protein phosphatase [Leucobacter komagatae]TQL42836.1 protein-tyrosine phosphatase [Leucobacter komagatae]
MTETLDRRIPLVTVPNLRTLGGLPVAGGTVAQGLLFRSATLGAVSPVDGEALVGLGIRRVVDFRTAGERRSAPDRLPAGVEGVDLDVLGDHARDLSASLAHLGMPGDEGRGEVTEEQLVAIRAKMSERLGDGRGVKILQDSNRLIVSSDSAITAFRGFYEALTEPGDYAPTLFHCTTGKDRTGWAAASFLLLLGADEETAMADYLQTNVDILPMIEPMLERAERNGVDSSLIKPVLTVHESMLQAAFDEMRERFGSIEGYFVRGLGLTEGRLAALADRFVAKA